MHINSYRLASNEVPPLFHYSFKYRLGNFVLHLSNKTDLLLQKINRVSYIFKGVYFIRYFYLNFIIGWGILFLWIMNLRYAFKS